MWVLLCSVHPTPRGDSGLAGAALRRTSRAILRPCPTTEPTPDISYYDDGAVRYRGFQLDGQMHGAGSSCARTAA